jgi:hypothetical protein
MCSHHLAFTAGWQALVGLKVPLWREPPTQPGYVREGVEARPTPRARRAVRPSLGCAAGVTALYADHDDDAFMTFGCAVDATF